MNGSVSGGDLAHPLGTGPVQVQHKGIDVLDGMAVVAGIDPGPGLQRMMEAAGLAGLQQHDALARIEAGDGSRSPRGIEQ